METLILFFFDEGSFVLKEVAFNKSGAAYLSQFQKAEYMLDRYDALVALRGSKAELKTRCIDTIFF